MNKSKELSLSFFFILPTDEFGGRREETRPLWKEKKMQRAKVVKQFCYPAGVLKKWICALWQQQGIFQSSFISHSESRSSRGCAKCRDKWTSFNLASLNNISAELFVTNVFALCCENITSLSSSWLPLTERRYVRTGKKNKQKASTKCDAYTTKKKNPYIWTFYAFLVSRDNELE